MAYCRLIPSGVVYDEHASIGRVVARASHRRTGLGRELMRRAIDEMESLFRDDVHKTGVMIGAQMRLQRFYESFGFEKASDMYIEDDIEHIKMLRTYVKQQ